MIHSSSGPEGDPELHQAVIRDHFRNPRNHGGLDAPAHEGSAHNPYCGDVVHVSARVEEGRISAIRFDGRGCTLSQAAASMVAAMAEGRTPTEVNELRSAFTAALGDESTAFPDALGDLRALFGVRKFPSRVRCVMLVFEALDAALTEAPSA